MSAIQTYQTPWQRLRSTNTTDSSLPSRLNLLASLTSVRTFFRDNCGTNAGGGTSQTTNPALIPIAADGLAGDAPCGLEFAVFGTNADNLTGQIRIGSYTLLKDHTGANQDVWKFRNLGTFDVTLSADVGVAGGIVTASHRFADTIALSGTTGNTASMAITSPADDSMAVVYMDIRGVHYIIPDFTTGGSAASLNAIFRTLG